METPRCYSCERQQNVEHDELVLVITGIDADCWHYAWTCESCDYENREFVDLATAERLNADDDVITEVLATVPADVLADRADQLADQEGQEDLFAALEEQFEPSGDEATSADEPATTLLDVEIECQGCSLVYQAKDGASRLFFFVLEPTFSLLATQCPHCDRGKLMFPEPSKLFELIELAQDMDSDVSVDLVLADRPPALVRQVRAEQLFDTLTETEGGE
jgi:hypothetical protein